MSCRKCLSLSSASPCRYVVLAAVGEMWGELLLSASTTSSLANQPTSSQAQSSPSPPPVHHHQPLINLCRYTVATERASSILHAVDGRDGRCGSTSLLVPVVSPSCLLARSTQDLRDFGPPIGLPEEFEELSHGIAAEDAISVWLSALRRRGEPL